MSFDNAGRYRGAPRVTERDAHAVSLERAVIAGLAPADGGILVLLAEPTSHPRALLRDMPCGLLDSELHAHADRAEDRLAPSESCTSLRREEFRYVQWPVPPPLAYHHVRPVAMNLSSTPPASGPARLSPARCNRRLFHTALHPTASDGRARTHLLLLRGGARHATLAARSTRRSGVVQAT